MLSPKNFATLRLLEIMLKASISLLLCEWRATCLLHVREATLSRMCVAVKVVSAREAGVEQKLVLRATLHVAPRFEISRAFTVMPRLEDTLMVLLLTTE